MPHKPNKRFWLLPAIAASAVLMAFAGWMALIFAPTEQSMGDIQRIFYFHVPSAWISFLAFFIVCLASIAYLVNRNPKWDLLAASSAEIGVLFITLVLITGPLWAKPRWNTFWTWDARLTTSLILWMIYIGYLFIRSFTKMQARGSTLAAVYGIIGFVDVPIVYFSIRWWRNLHPGAVIASSSGGLATEMLIALLAALLAFTSLYAVLLYLWYQYLHLEHQLYAWKSNRSGGFE